jgi:hypothetical protein
MMVRSYTVETGDRYFLRMTQRCRKYHGEACIWFRPEDSMETPYRASVALFKQIQPRVSDTVKYIDNHFSNWRDAEAWSIAEYQRLRDQEKSK